MMTKIWKQDVLTTTLEDKLMKAFVGSIKELTSDLQQHVETRSPAGDISPYKSVYRLFFNSLLDLSVNEKTIHYYSSSELVLDGPYPKYESVLVTSLQAFTKKILETGQKVKNLSLAGRAMEDIKTVFSSVPARTEKDIVKVQAEITIKFFKCLLKMRLK